MRLTDEMKSEMRMIAGRTDFLNDEFLADAPHFTLPIQMASLKEQHGDELESYKVKLENFYVDTDIKEKLLKISFYATKVHIASRPMIGHLSTLKAQDLKAFL